MDARWNWISIYFLKPSDKWDREYLKAVAAAIRQYQPDNAEKIIQRYLSEERQAELNVTNTYARRIFRARIIDGRPKCGGPPFSKGRHRHVVIHCSPRLGLL